MNAVEDNVPTSLERDGREYSGTLGDFDDFSPLVTRGLKSMREHPKMTYDMASRLNFTNRL